MEKEFRTAQAMIGIFCRGHHGPGKELCPECRVLLDYVRKRLEKCPFRERKPRCSQCPVHCYRPELRETIRDVMKYAGPRMPWRHPLLTWRHYLTKKRGRW